MAGRLVLADTTHWIAFFGGGDAEARAAVAVLLATERLLTCSVVIAEVIRGFSVDTQAAFAIGVLRKCRYLSTRREIAEKAGWLGRGGSIVRFAIPTSDLLIAATSIEERVPVLTSDPHFKRIAGCLVVSSRDVLRGKA